LAGADSSPPLPDSTWLLIDSILPAGHKKRKGASMKNMNLNIVCAVIIGLALILGGCPNPTSGDETTPKKLSMGYLSNLMIDIGDATALGIAKQPAAGSQNIRARAVTDSTETVGKNYLVKTTTDITPGDVAWDESGLTKVTFKKKTTIDTAVTIPVYDEEGNTVYLLDAKGNPVRDEEGNPVIKTQVIETQAVTQDEIPAQVNRLYIYNSYTYIQFVPNDTRSIPDIRPIDLGKQDKNGYYEYDKQNYYNDDFHQSFVIENTTGNIYSVEDTVHIETVHNGLLKLKDSPYIWDCRIKGNDDLEFFTLFQNTAVIIYDYFKDKYGNNYICNSLLNVTDSSNNTVFFTGSTGNYFAASTGEILYIQEESPYSADYWGYWRGDGEYFDKNYCSGALSSSVPQIRIVGKDLQYRMVDHGDELQFNGFEHNGGVHSNLLYAISHIKNKRLYAYNYSGGGGLGFVVLKTDSGEAEYSIGIHAEDMKYPVNFNTFIYRKDGNLYYHTFDYNTLPTTNYTLEPDVASSVLLLQNIGAGNWPWIVTTINSQDEYTVVVKEVNGERIPVAVKTSEYVAEEQQTIVLKPINR
jgi:hypothetical protein